jgi:hypothetical protein
MAIPQIAPGQFIRDPEQGEDIQIIEVLAQRGYVAASFAAMAFPRPPNRLVIDRMVSSLSLSQPRGKLYAAGGSNSRTDYP